ncbi:uncharacterized protein N0V89_004917 [Didymosphaeria variabile]|uniref:Uncharacterized protein n=1 Tax=Didymosphaeria variabile TaxID=1932322 RepID=A0A9W8XK34_9PLEO|nr:uncharacterized protein N0V89_004917 [Didymosphaeria variabile]KAJ4353191.1 hypothetical protein N0V89_004917 [Didymosphaeria variabile]
MPLSLLISGLAFTTPLTAAASNPGPNKIDVEALKSDPALKLVFTDIAAAVNKPVSEVQQHTIETLSSPEMATLLTQLRDNPNQKPNADVDAEKMFTAAFNAALGTGLKKRAEGESRKAKAKRGAAEDCVQKCVDIRTQSCEMLDGMNVGEKSCGKWRIQQECKYNCEA